MLAYETGVPNSVDPLGGSFEVEALTDALERDAEEIFLEIDRQGGMIAAIDKGYFRRRIADSAFAYQREVDRGRKLVVGVNAFVESEPSRIPILQIDESIERKQVTNLKALRAGRDSAASAAALEGVRRAARSQENIMPALLEAARHDATVGETVAALADGLGRYTTALA